MRGGLDDALDKLARRDELRRRAAGEANGTPPAVTELVEAIAGVIAHNPHLGVTVGVEGAGDPLLLHFYFADGQVQVNAENAMTAPPTSAATAAPRHADFVVAVDATVEEARQPGYEERFYGESDTAERRYGGFDAPQPEAYPMPAPPRPQVPPQPGPPPPQPSGQPAPLAEPIPLQVERPEETEMAARRLAALLRDDPSLLNRPPD